MRTTPLAPVSSIEIARQNYLFYKDEEAEAKAKKSAARKSLMDYITSNGDPDEDGHLRWEFDDPITINDKTYKGLMNQKRKSTFIDEDKALELAENLGVLEEITTYEPVYDWDKLYVLNQEGKISDEELDSIFGVNIDWALVVIKA